MNRTVKQTLIAISTLTLIGTIGCADAADTDGDVGYESRIGSLSGSDCDALLVRAAEADAANRDRVRAKYRTCLEDAVEERGGKVRTRTDVDRKCNAILDDVAHAVQRVRNSRDVTLPECTRARRGTTNMCRLMDAYEVCELDHDRDGEPDAERLPPVTCRDLIARAKLNPDVDNLRRIVANHCRRTVDGDRTRTDDSDRTRDGETDRTSDRNTDGRRLDAFCTELRRELSAASGDRARHLHRTYQAECSN